MANMALLLPDQMGGASGRAAVELGCPWGVAKSFIRQASI